MSTGAEQLALDGVDPGTSGRSHDFSLEVAGMTKRFGALVALDNVSLRLRRGTVHALLGENGAGKSTLVKCVMGYQGADEGSVAVDGRERSIGSTRDAHALGLGMVYQHFTLVPAMTVLENLVLAESHLPAVVNWSGQRRRLQNIMSQMPFRVDLDRSVATLAAGEKQKVEILKQLFLNRSILFLDEPSSVLTPDEADEVLGSLRQRVREHGLSVLLITHKMREVMGYADDVTVLRQGRRVATGRVAGHDPDSLASAMMGEDTAMAAVDTPRVATHGQGAALSIRELGVTGDRGTRAVDGLSLTVRPGEIVGVAGVSGNGQRELVEALNGQRPIDAGQVRIGDEPFSPTRRAMTRYRFRCLPEEPLHNGCVPSMTVAENLSLRRFDFPEMTRGRWLLDRGAQRRLALKYIQDYDIRTQSTESPMRDLSGGNVQRTVLARELEDEPRYLVVANPCFGLDFAAAAQIRRRLVEARNRGAAVLLLSEDLDEVMELSDRIVVLFAGRIAHEVSAEKADRADLGRYMAGR